MIPKICKILDIKCEEIRIKTVTAWLVEGCCMFEHNLIDSPIGRDLLHRAYLKYAGLDGRKNYTAMLNELKGSL